MFAVHSHNVCHQLQCMLTVSCTIPWLHCQSLADQDCPILWCTGAAFPCSWSGFYKCAPAESPHCIIDWV